jgi:hypothetical protein
VETNEPAGTIAGEDAGLPDSGVDAGELGAAGDAGTEAAAPSEADGSAFVELCQAPQPNQPLFLAFDTYGSDYASFHLYSDPTGGGVCSGYSIGEVWLGDYEAPPPNAWTTQCVELLPPSVGYHVFVVPNEVGSLVRNVRFVAGCECRRVRKEWTSCGIQDPQGAAGGSACF